MTRLLPAAALGLLALATALRAEDPRLWSRLFDPDAVVRIEGSPSVQATIRFADDELIENVAIGDSNALAGDAEQARQPAVREAARRQGARPT